MVGPRKNGQIDVDLHVKTDCKVQNFGSRNDTEAHLCGNYGRSIATTHVEIYGLILIDVSMSVRWSVREKMVQ